MATYTCSKCLTAGVAGTPVTTICVDGTAHNFVANPGNHTHCAILIICIFLGDIFYRVANFYFVGNHSTTLNKWLQLFCPKVLNYTDLDI